jgi:hypothetical protein
MESGGTLPAGNFKLSNSDNYKAISTTYSKIQNFHYKITQMLAFNWSDFYMHLYIIYDYIFVRKASLFNIRSIIKMTFDR